jgi:hypothetical protein
MILGRGESPPRGRMRIVGDATTSGDRGCDSGLDLIRRDRHVDMETAPARSGWVQLMEPQMRAATVGIDGIFVVEIVVPESGRKEWPHVRIGVLGDRNADALDL